MAPEAKLDGDLASTLVRHGEEQGFWTILPRDGLLVRVRLHAPDRRIYLVELDCTAYGDEPIGGRFITQGGLCVADAWPRGNPTFEQWVKFQPGNLFICWDQDRYAINNHHHEWRARKAWAKSINPIHSYLNFLRQLLHLPSRGYQRQAQAATA